MYTDTLARDKGGMTALALARVKVGNMEKLSSGGASADEAPPGLAVGRWVRATETFTVDQKFQVSKGSLGRVAEIDDGYASIDFEGLDAKQSVYVGRGTGLHRGLWVGTGSDDPTLFGTGFYFRNRIFGVQIYGIISVLSQEDVLKERAYYEEVVAMLMAPTQATS